MVLAQASWSHQSSMQASLKKPTVFENHVFRTQGLGKSKALAACPPHAPALSGRRGISFFPRGHINFGKGPMRAD